MTRVKVPNLQNNRGHEFWLPLCISLALASMIAAVYAPVRQFEFLNYDDDIYVCDNVAIQAGITLEGFRWALTFAEIGHWHPLTWVSHMVDCEVFGLNPAGHHIMSVLLHMATAILLFTVLRLLTGEMWPCALAAALFAIHPLRVESVAWISERKDVLSGLFFVLTLWAYVRYVRKPDSRLRYVAMTALFALGLLSKNMLVTLPFVLLLLDYWPLHRFDVPKGQTWWPVLRSLIIEKVPLLLLSFASCVATCLSPETISPSGRWTLAFRVENALASHAAYLRQLFAPTDLAVPYTAASNGIAFWKIAAVLCLVFALTWLAVAQRQKRPYLTVGWLWYLGMSMPVIGLIQISYYARADRYTYLPQIGLAIAIAWLAKDFAARRQLRAVVPVLALAVLAVLALRTRDQVSVWRNDATLWTHTIKVMPGNVYGHNGLGLALANRGRLDEAIWHYREALKSKPDFVQTLNNLGNALLGQKKADEAISCFREALRIQPDLSLSHNNLGNALGEAGKTDEAIAAYREAIRLKQDFAPAYGNLGNALLTQNRVEEAVLAHREALRLQPNGPNRHLNLGTALLKQGNLEEAIFHLTKVLRFGPSAVEAHVSLADAFLQQGRPGEAIALCNDALRIKPDFPEAHYQIGKILSIQGRFQDAMAHYEEALRLRPDYAEAHNNLGNLLATTGQIEPAVSHYEKALQLQPTNVEAHNNLGGLLLQQDRLQDAIAEYESALRLRPSFVPALRNLAWIRAASGNPAFRDANSAIQLARRAVELTDNKDAAALDVLAAALAENRQMDEAVAVATEARQLALAAKQAAMVNQIETRLKLYTNGSPYRLNQ